MRRDAKVEPGFVVRHAEGDYALGTLAHYLVGVWGTELSVRSAVHWGRALDDLRSAMPGARLALMTFVEGNCRLPVPGATAEIFVDALQRNSEVIAGATVVYDRDGFWGAGLRSQMTAVLGESKAELPHRLARTVDEATAWLVRTLADPNQARAAALQRAVEDLRAGLRPVESASH